eukprot:2530510-Ditylum_brightwellii.AAC.1
MQSDAKKSPTSKSKRDLDYQRKKPCLANIPNPRVKSIQIKHEPEVILCSPDDQTNMALTSNTHDNGNTEDDTETDDAPTSTTATDDDDNNEPNDESNTSHQSSVQPYGMNVNLPITYIATLE